MASAQAMHPHSHKDTLPNRQPPITINPLSPTNLTRDSITGTAMPWPLSMLSPLPTPRLSPSAWLASPPLYYTLNFPSRPAIAPPRQSPACPRLPRCTRRSPACKTHHLDQSGATPLTCLGRVGGTTTCSNAGATCSNAGATSQ